MADRHFSALSGGWIRARVREVLAAAESSELEDLAAEGLLPDAVPGGRVVAGVEGVLLGAHLLEELDFGVVPVESATRPVLAAFAARVAGLDAGNGEGWLDRLEEVLERGRFEPAEVRGYLRQSRHEFGLYDQVRPFMQDPRLLSEVTEPGPAGRLAMDRPSGANAMWSGRMAETAAVPSGEALGWVLAWRAFGPSGMGAVRTRGGRASKSCKAGPARSLLRWFPRGRNLFESLVLSIPPPASWPSRSGEDLAPWESELLPDPLAPPAPCGVVSLLTGRFAHAVLLVPGGDGAETVGCRVAWGTSVDLPAAVDPYVIDRSAGGPIRADHRRAMWRDVDALLLKERPAGKVTARRPQVFDTAPDLPVEVRRALRVRVLGWDQDKQDKNSAWVVAETPPVLELMEERSPDGASAVAAAHRMAEEAGSLLYRSLARVWHELNPGRRSDDREGFVGPAVAAFMEQAETEFWRVVADPSGAAPQFWRLAREVFDEATLAVRSATVRGMAAVQRARGPLAGVSGTGGRTNGNRKVTT
ncbi:type I-E CRISPR-associated protein Cse1/CasA [Streptomyces sp. XY431]|uniref:type I-E CRISPR-associated protein Cse1/CasA n=1 Tax=Streptomyces sp. XY431 TaxID=1415562 RepID=UPI0006AE9DF9|nr:type I-E CRISPR-associated protein Cse1/CasA [Streptomyces sp. XY431]